MSSRRLSPELGQSWRAFVVEAVDSENAVPRSIGLMHANRGFYDADVAISLTVSASLAGSSRAALRAGAARSYFTVIVILFEATTGVNGTWSVSPIKSCSVCCPGGKSSTVSVCPPPKCR
jgi:hypothetical protein